MTEPTILERFRKALFEAFVWTQVVEVQVKHLTPGLGNRCPLSRRIKALKPRISREFYCSLDQLREHRNAVVHESDYVYRVLDSGSDESYLPSDDDIELLEEVAQLAVQLWADLLEVDAELPPAADRPTLNPTASS